MSCFELSEAWKSFEDPFTQPAPAVTPAVTPAVASVSAKASGAERPVERPAERPAEHPRTSIEEQVESTASTPALLHTLLLEVAALKHEARRREDRFFLVMVLALVCAFLYVERVVLPRAVSMLNVR